MKTLLFGIILASLLSGCSGSSGGTTAEPTPPVVVVVPPVVVPPPASEFNLIQSSFSILNMSGTEISTIGVGQSFKLRLTAKDQYGALMSGLSIKFSRVTPILADIPAVETSTGVYEATVSESDQVREEFYVKKDNASVNFNKEIFVSFCEIPNYASLPIVNTSVQSGDTFYIICTPAQLASASSFPNRNFLIGKNIDLASFYTDANSDLIPDNQFKIGSSANPYTGKFKGYS